MRKIVIFILFSVVFISCNKTNKPKVDVSKIDAPVKLMRFDVDFYTASETDLPKIKVIYPMFFPHNIDSVWIHKIQNKDEQELFAETQKLYRDFSDEKEQLEKLFKHIKYYNPKFKTPKVITMLTNLDYQNRVVYTDSLLLISLDIYLGKAHTFYSDFPKYIKQNNTKNHIIVDVANTFIDKQIPPNKKRDFLGKMIYAGKKMYLLDAYLPNVSDQEKIGYATEKFEWAKNNEENVWRYFIDKDLLYSTDTKLNKRFLDTAPFSKFYLSEDNKSPGQIGRYIGWQIVRSYMKNNDVSLHELMKTSEDKIFKKSNYKPRR